MSRKGKFWLVSVNGRIKVYVIFCAKGLGLTDYHSLLDEHDKNGQ